MAISLTRLSGGNTPADGSDPRTFPAIWNASATAIEGALADTGASVTVSETAPVSPNEGDLWLNSTEAKMYVYYDDGTSAQWVAAVGGTVPSQGKILQVVSTEKTDTFSTSSTSFTDVTGLSVSITPSSASSKILVFCTLNSSPATTSVGFARLMRDATAVFIGDSSGSRTRASSHISQNYTSADIGLHTLTWNYLDSPATTSAVTYKAQVGVSSGSMFVNRSNDSTDSASRGVTASSITVMEVAA